jgi:mercuric ion transport protein
MNLGMNANHISADADGHAGSDVPVGTSLWLMGGAGLLAALSASCCVLPIGLSLIGLGGTWLAVLGPFVAWRFEIMLVSGAVLAWAWARILRRWRCLSRRGATLAVAALATLALAATATAPLWEEAAARGMFALWNAR